MVSIVCFVCDAITNVAYHSRFLDVVILFYEPSSGCFMPVVNSVVDQPDVLGRRAGLCALSTAATSGLVWLRQSNSCLCNHKFAKAQLFARSFMRSAWGRLCMTSEPSGCWERSTPAKLSWSYCCSWDCNLRFLLLVFFQTCCLLLRVDRKDRDYFTQGVFNRLKTEWKITSRLCHTQVASKMSFECVISVVAAVDSAVQWL